MTIFIKNKHELQIDDFTFKCCIGKKGTSKRKIEGDYKTPKGLYSLGCLYYRADRVKKPITKIKTIKINKNMGWSNDTRFPKSYNKLININKKIKHEKINRNDHKYDLLILIKYNYKKVKNFKGSCIFIHLTNNYKPTAGCVALKKKDFLILLKLITKKTKILIS